MREKCEMQVVMATDTVPSLSSTSSLQSQPRRTDLDGGGSGKRSRCSSVQLGTPRGAVAHVLHEACERCGRDTLETLSLALRARESEKCERRGSGTGECEGATDQRRRARSLEPLPHLVAHARHGVVVDARVDREVLVAEEERNVVRLPQDVLLVPVVRRVSIPVIQFVG